MIPIYIILGAAGSGRREITLDLIEYIGENEKGKTILLLAENEKSSPYDEQIQALHEVTLVSWNLLLNKEIIVNQLPKQGETLFFITNGRLNPVDQIEALREWIRKNNLQVARTLSVINCKLCEKESSLNKWYEACIHFSEGRVSNPALVIYPEPRRLSLVFDDEDAENANPQHDLMIEEDISYDDEVQVENDPYLKRLPNGLREKLIANFRDYLE